jgi:hypothetical protein
MDVSRTYGLLDKKFYLSGQGFLLSILTFGEKLKYRKIWNEFTPEA